MPSEPLMFVCVVHRLFYSDDSRARDRSNSPEINSPQNIDFPAKFLFERETQPVLVPSGLHFAFVAAKNISTHFIGIGRSPD